MPNRRTPTLDEVVRQAGELPQEQRSAFLAHSCAHDKAMLSAASQEMRQRGWSNLDSQGLPPQEVPVLRDGYATITRIGPYRVVRQIGEGGMGEVLLAERDQADFKQQVAIKLVRRGVLSRQIQGRLKIERQILASLAHPNIARLLDGGTTTEGAPYIVMEYVDGVPIDVYCDQQRLTIEQRLKLFQTVCSAVHYAHQNLVVHRDLKPSNILVKADGTPTLLDFGIAKLLDDRYAMHTLAMTQADVRLLTPDHASPEQVLGLPITTASDTYVLGVLLYELLVGRRPFSFNANRLSEVERAICEESPVTPSELLAHMRDQAELGKLADARSTSPSKLRRTLVGDLDNIVLMAMRKEPDRRYSSVEQLASDIERFLVGLPIVARADTWTYRTQKFVRRHTVGVGLSLALGVSLLAFAATSFIQAERIAEERDLAASQRAVAERQRGRAEQVSTFLVDLFRVNDPTQARGREISAAEILDRGAARIEQELQSQPDVQASLLETVGRVYLSLGLLDPAHQALERAVDKNRELQADDATLASSLSALSRVLWERGRLDEAQKLQQEAIELSAREHGRNSLPVADGLSMLGKLMQSAGDLTSAQRVLRDSLRLYREAAVKDQRVASVLSDLGVIALDHGEYDKAEGLYREAIEIDRTLGEDHPAYAMHMHNLALVLQAKGELSAADATFRDSLERYFRVFGEDHPDTIAALGNHANFQRQLGNLTEAEQVYRRVVAAERRVRGERHTYVGYDMANLASVLIGKRELNEAEQLLRQALDIYREQLPKDHVYVGSALHLLGSALLEQRRAKEALPLLERSAAIIGQHMPSSPNEAIVHAGLGRAHFLLGDEEQAETLLAASYQTLKDRSRTNPRTQEAAKWLTDLYEKMGRPERVRHYRHELRAMNTAAAQRETATER